MLVHYIRLHLFLRYIDLDKNEYRVDFQNSNK